MSEKELDKREWSEGEGISEMDARKIRLAVDRFWARRGMLGKVWERIRRGVEDVGG